jgi:hypothetical protein
MQTGKDRHNDIRKDTTQYDNKPLRQIGDTLVFCEDIRMLKVFYSDDILLHSLRFVLKDTFNDFFLEKDALASCDGCWDSLDYRIENLFDLESRIKNVIAKEPTALDSLLFVVQNMEKNEEIVEQIGHWCEAYMALFIGGKHLYSEHEAEILFDMPEIYSTTRLFLVDTTMQNSYSLSTSQLFYLKYEICNYLSILPDKERLSFYKSYFERIYNRED